MANTKSGRFNEAKARRSAKHEKSGKYVRQRSRTSKNKLRKLKKHIERHPNDLQAMAHV